MEKDNSKDKKRKNEVWTFLASVRLAVVLLIAIAAASILGTFIPQQEASQDLIRRLPSGAAVVMQKLQLFDLYHSSWFLLLLGLLALNLVVCFLNRLPIAIRRFRLRLPADALPGFENIPPDRTIFSDGSVDDEARRVEELLRQSFRRVQKRETEKGLIISGGKGAFAPFGVYFVHLGILVILAGAIVGDFAGFDGYTSIPEGGASDAIFLKGNREARKLGFTIRCDRFTVDYYENGMPKLYRSDITLLKNGRTVKQGALLVNHPMEFDGMHIYQASYDTLPAGEATLRIVDGSGGASERRVQAGEKFKLSGVEAELSVLRVENDIMNMGPAVKLAVNGGGVKLVFWIFRHIDDMVRQNPGLLKRVPMFNPALFKPFVFSLSGIETTYVTGLQVNRDPGAPIVAVGAMMMILGIIVTFYIAHRRVYVRLDRARGKTRISFAGRSNRDAARLEKEIDLMLKRYHEGERKR